MNDNFTNRPDRDNEAIAQKLNQVAEETHADLQFAARLEEQLRNNYHPQTGWLATWAQVAPALRWVVLMVLLALVLSWSIKSLVPAPQPAINTTPTLHMPGTETTTPGPITFTATPFKQTGGYDFRGAKLYLSQPLPESPDKGHIYLLKKDEPATLEGARLLADRFGIQGEVYTAPDYLFGKKDYAFSDGKQLLQVYSNRYFSYTADMAKSRTDPYGFKPSDRAATTIQEFLKARGFDFPFSLSEGNFPGEYILKPLAPDSIPMQYESFTPPVVRVALDENGEVLSIDATLMDYDPTPLGEYEIISAQEAFQTLLNDNILAGKMEFFNAPDRMPQEWYRSYPNNQPVTIYGYVSSYPTIDSSQPPLVFINGVSVKGNITGLEGLDDNTFVKATGQYLVENGIRKFQVDSWITNIEPVYISGTPRHEGDQIILTASEAGTDQQAPLVGPGKQYLLIDPPADLPFDNKPDSQLNVEAVLVDGKLFWTYIQYFETTSHVGGGGGNGLGFYKLNFSGTPVPFPPSPTPQVNTQVSITYVVKEGDTVQAIAEAYGITPDKIFKANSGLDGGVLTVGKTIVIPGSQLATDNPNPFIGTYTIKEGDTLTAIAQTFGTTVDKLMQLNHLTDSNIYVGQTLSVPMAEFPEQQVQDLRGYLSISIHKKADGTLSREYALDVIQNQGSTMYTMEGPILSELDSYNALPILITGKIDKTGKLVVGSYKIPYPDLHFQILKGTQKVQQLEGQNVTVFTTEDGKSYVEYLVTNNIPNTTSITGNQGDRIEQEVLIIPDETYAGLPVAHIYQTALVQENGPALEHRANQIYTINESDLPSPNYIQPNLTIDRVELVYYVSNPYYQINDPNYSQRSPYIQPAWHFRGRYEDGGEFDILIQALKQEFLLPELAPHLSPG